MRKSVTLLLLSLAMAGPAIGDVVTLTESNSKSILESARLSFINFYADWCRYSQSLMPVIDELELKLKSEFPDNSQLTIGKVDCQAEAALAKEYGVMKYPTMKLFRYGHMQRREYRGQRSVEAIGDFIRSQMLDELQLLTAPVDAASLPLESGEGAIVGRFASNQSAGFGTFRRVADQMGQECKFIAVLGSKDDPDKVVFQKGTDPTTQVSLAYIEEEAAMRRLVQEQCASTVRELTFENAEEMAEDGNPMFVLFYRADDTEIVEKYKAIVEKHLRQYSDRINFVYGQGPLFTKALRHLRKTVNDLPLIAIDSFQHIYTLPHDARETIASYPSRLAAFIEDLISGRLHKEFHKSDGAADSGSGENSRTATPEPRISVFRRLLPSPSRYSFSREEL